jgi:pimeloyl-ACP methyl ester carboxylesterase
MLRRSLPIALAGSMLALATTASAEVPEVIDDPAYTRPERLVDIGGRKMNIHCLGAGSPTVVLESGLSDPSNVWAFVQPLIAKTTRVCSYDRAGMGYSEPSGRPSTSAHIVADLRALLRAARIEPPYVLVGHSFGSLNVRLFTDMHLSEIAGMVLIDPSHEDQLARYAAIEGSPDPKAAARYARHQTCVSEGRDGIAPGTPLYEKCVDAPNPRFGPAMNAALAAIQAQPSFQVAQLSEFENILNGVSPGQVRAAKRTYGALPLIVLTRGNEPDKAPADEQTPRLKVMWQMHDELARLSTTGSHRAVPGSGHYIQIDRPEVVVAAVNDVVRRSVGAGSATPR